MKYAFPFLSILFFPFFVFSQEIATDYLGNEYYNTRPGSSVITLESEVENYNDDAESFVFPVNYSTSDLQLSLENELNKNTINSLKADILKNAFHLTTNNNFNHYGNEGLAYVWGSKNSSIKTKPVDYAGYPNICSEELYGLDCSGFIYEILINSKLNLPENPRYYANANWFSIAKNWKEPLDQYLNCVNCYKVYNLNTKSIDDIKSGDIIYFLNDKKVYHIGITFKYKNKLIFFESGGSPRYDCSTNIKKGPRAIELTKTFLEKRNYKILRFTETD